MTWFSGFHIRIIGILAFTIIACQCLYEDQVGKFDWRLENIGQVQHVIFDASQKSKQMLVASKGNVIASLSTTTGSMAWRHVLEDSLLLDAIALSNSALTVSSHNIRRWNMNSGYLQWQMSLQQPVQRGEYVVAADAILVVGSVKAVAYNLKTGLEMWSVDTPWEAYDELHVGEVDGTAYVSVLIGQQLSIYILKDEVIKEQTTLSLRSSKYSCSGSSARWLVCYDLTRQVLEYLDVTSPQISWKPITHKLELVDLPDVMVVGDNGVIIQSAASGVHFKLSAASAVEVVRFKGRATVTSTPTGESVLLAVSSSVVSPQKAELHVKVYSIEDGEELKSYASTVSAETTALPSKVAAFMYSKAGSSHSYKVVVVFGDHSVSLFQQSGRVVWTREEALASITTLEMVDLPVSEVEAKMEEEFGSHTTYNVIGQFMGRLIAQFQQLSSFLVHTYHKHVSGLRVVLETPDHTALDEDYLTRDEFNLHKIIIAVSSVGKVFGLDSFTGKVMWSQYIADLQPFSSSSRLLLYVQRSTAHYPHEPFATIIGQRLCDQCGALVFSFNPLTGQASSTHPLLLPYEVEQAMMLPAVQHDFLKPLVLVDTLKQVHVYPKDCQLPVPHQLFVFSAQPVTGEIVGLRLTGESLQSLSAERMWSVALGSHIVALKGKESREHVHSLGKVQSDRSVLYKYVNPNLVAVITESEGNSEHAWLAVRLLDAVTGRIIFTCEHKRSSGPVHLVHSENWLVYTYYNTKARRMEISVLELYEGLSQANSTTFSSLENNLSPIVMRQAYILGTSISALSTTLTERGITGKNILMARTMGGIVEVAKAFLDPRRPLEPTAATKEEGLHPYMPELPLSYEGTINYNQSVFRIRDIHSEPSGLESTSLIVAYGLDLFHTRIAPSKMYDMLKDDFDYLFIGAVTLGMIVVSFVSRYFALSKQMKRAWK